MPFTKYGFMWWCLLIFYVFLAAWFNEKFIRRLYPKKPKFKDVFGKNMFPDVRIVKLPWRDTELKVAVGTSSQFLHWTLTVRPGYPHNFDLDFALSCRESFGLDDGTIFLLSEQLPYPEKNRIINYLIKEHCKIYGNKITMKFWGTFYDGYFIDLITEAYEKARPEEYAAYVGKQEAAVISPIEHFIQSLV